MGSLIKNWNIGFLNIRSFKKAIYMIVFLKEWTIAVMLPVTTQVQKIERPVWQNHFVFEKLANKRNENGLWQGHQHKHENPQRN